MYRRGYLAGLGAVATGLGGCLAPIAGSSVQRRVHLAARDGIPAEYDLRMDATVVDSRVTPEHTARVRITTTNEGPNRALSVGDPGCGPFDRAEGASDEPPGLWLHRPAIAADVERDGNRWTRDPAGPPRSFDAEGCPLRVYESGESLTQDYVVWDDYRTEGYFEPGTYRWQTRVAIYRMDAVRYAGGGTTTARATGDPSATLRWGFALVVERPD